MSDKAPISLDQAVSAFTGGTPETEQASPEAAPEEGRTPEAADLSESEDEAEEQPDADDGEQDSEDDDAGETDDAEEPEEADDEEPSFTITLDGKEHEVSLSELRDGYQRQADYTRKTQALTEQRKTLEGHAEQVTKKREEAIALLEAIPTQLLGTPPERPDIGLARSDPATYEEQKYQWEQWHALRQNFGTWHQQLVQEREQENAAKRAKTAETEGQKFLKVFAEEVKDEASFGAKVSEITSYLQSLPDGLAYAPQELAGMIDHRAYVIADKARRYDALMAENKPKAELKAKKAKLKPVNSGSAQRKPKRSSERDQARDRFIKSTSRPEHQMSRKEQIDAAAAAFAAGSAKD